MATPGPGALPPPPCSHMALRSLPELPQMRADEGVPVVAQPAIWGMPAEENGSPLDGGSMPHSTTSVHAGAHEGTSTIGPLDAGPCTALAAGPEPSPDLSPGPSLRTKVGAEMGPKRDTVTLSPTGQAAPMDWEGTEDPSSAISEAAKLDRDATDAFSKGDKQVP